MVKEFLHLEDLKLSRRDISCLTSAHGKECNDLDSILQCLHDFYAKLYSKQDVPDDLDEFLANLNILKVQDTFVSIPYVSENDVLDAIKKLNIGKSPGPDGFTLDFNNSFHCRFVGSVFQ